MAETTRYEVIVELKGEVLDPEGRAIKESLTRLGHGSVQDVKVSKRFVVDLTGGEAQASRLADEIAREYLANPISQTYRVKKV